MANACYVIRGMIRCQSHLALLSMIRNSGIVIHEGKLTCVIHKHEVGSNYKNDGCEQEYFGADVAETS